MKKTLADQPETKISKSPRSGIANLTDPVTKRKDTILIVDDDPIICQVLQVLLEDEGYRVASVTDSQDCLPAMRRQHPDLVLLDIMMPGKDGRTLCRELRTVSNAPIVIMSALTSDQEKASRLNDGADDYISKPFSNAELIARIRAVLRRMHHGSRGRIYRDETLIIDFDAQALEVNGVPTELSPREWRLLEYLYRHQGRTVAREVLLNHVWGAGYEHAYDNLKVFISNLRRKLQDPARHPRYIFTEHELGYRFQGHK